MAYWFGKRETNCKPTTKKRQTIPNPSHTFLVQVPGQLDGGLHVLVVLQEAHSEGGLVVGVLRLGLDGRLHAGLRHLRRRGPAAADGVVSVGPVRDRVRLLGAEQAAPGAVLQRDVEGKHGLERMQRLAALCVQRGDLRNRQRLRPVHVIRVQVLVDRPYDGPERRGRGPGPQPRAGDWHLAMLTRTSSCSESASPGRDSDDQCLIDGILADRH